MAVPYRNDDDVSSDGLLQTNATVIAGVLIFLTISSSVAPQYPETLNRTALIYSAALIIVPIAYSSTIILRAKYSPEQTIDALKDAKKFAFYGFLLLYITLPSLAILSIFGLFQEDIAVQCAKDPKKFNITDQSKCSDFSQGSLAERCAKNPNSFNLKLNQCSKFIPNVPSKG